MYFQVVEIYKNFSNIYIEKNPCVSGTTQFKPILFKGPLYFIL